MPEAPVPGLRESLMEKLLECVIAFGSEADGGNSLASLATLLVQQWHFSPLLLSGHWHFLLISSLPHSVSYASLALSLN
jgi:hypothetical protein